MIRRCVLVLCLVLGVTTCAKPMNVIFILADDLGWADTTLYGQTRLYQTPNLERLARCGMTFTRAYANSPLCSPTRASIMTGQTPARHGSTAPQHHTAAVRMQASVAASAPPGNKALQTQSVTRLDTAYPTLAKQLKAVGYATGHFGKWHLGPEPYSPLEHGFDVDIPHHPGPGPAGSFVAPWKFRNFKANAAEEHIEDRMAAEAAKWMQTVKDKPFYMNYWQFSVHAPFNAKAALIEKYRESIDPSKTQRCPTYAAMVESLDDAIGTLLDAVDEAGIADRTAIIFSSDNGGNMYDVVEGERATSNSPLRGGKATMFEGGIRVPCVVVWPGVTESGSRSHAIIQTSDFYPTILARLGVSLPARHAVDGIDITPALRGYHLNREAIFTYFPHSPPVPDWLPPSMSVHAGDWKLIRLFHQGKNGKHDYLLYNLTDDIGETRDLAAQFPERVTALDRLIEAHIEQTRAVVPRPNPRFDPDQYRPRRVGVPSAKNSLPIDLVFANYQSLLQQKQTLQKDDPNEHARLIEQADHLMGEAPESVVHKTMSPPGGDKHDYLTLAPYWWPDPARADGLPYIRRDGRVNPETRGDNTDYARRKRLFTRVHTLGMAAFYTDDLRYARRAVTLLETWFVNPATRMTPHLNYAQGVPGRSDGRCYGIIEWAGIDDLITPIQLLRARGVLSGVTDLILTQWFAAYLHWLRTSDMGRREDTRLNNHATWYDVQVVGLCLFLGKRAEARDVLEAVKTRRIATQIEPDGRQPHELARTKSLSYSRMNLRAFERLAELGEKVGVDLWNYETEDGRSIRKAQAFLQPYLKGESEWPYQQIK